MSDMYVLDTERSTIAFAVRHLYGLRTIRGRFRRFSGVVDLSGTPAVSLTVDAASVDTGRARRDRRLRSPLLLDGSTPRSASSPSAPRSTASARPPPAG